MASVRNYNPADWEDVSSSNYNPDDWEDIQSGSEQPVISDLVGSAMRQTPIGMASSGAHSVARGIGKAFDVTGIPVPPGVSRGAQRLFQPSRAVGVGLATQMTGQPPMDVTRNTLEAIKPGYEPRNIVEQAGSSLGETAAVVGPSIVSPAIGGPLAMMAQQAQSGRVSPLPLATPIFSGSRKILGKVQRRVVPPLLKSTKGIPEEASEMAINNPEIWNRPGTSRSVQQQSQNIIEGIKEAGTKTGRDFGAAYKEAGMNSPVDEIIAGNKSRFSGKGFEQLQQDYHAAIRGEMLKSKAVKDAYTGAERSPVDLPANEKLSVLTDLKRALQNQTIYPPAGQQLSQSQGAQNAAIKQMAADIDRLRGTIPGGEKLALADDAWAEMEGIRENLWRAFKDPYTGQDYLNRIMKGNLDWLTAGRNAGRVGAIQRVEQITGKELLRPALEEMAAAYLKNPRMMGLPSTRIMAVINSLVPARFLTNPAPKRILSTVPRAITGTLAGSRVQSIGNGIKTASDHGQNNPNYRQENRDQNNYNRDIKSRSNQVTPKRLLGQREAKIPTPEILLDYLRKARGDKDKARKMAISDGYDISKRVEK